MKKNTTSAVLLAFILTILTFNAYTQLPNTWTQKSNFGGIAVASSVGFSIGSKGYIGTGDGLGKRKDFWEYNPVTDAWSQKADFGGSARVAASGFSIGTKGYIGTGDDAAIVSDFWEYDPATNSWIQKADFPGTPRYGATGFSIGSKGYLGTGHATGFENRVNDFWEFDPNVGVSGTWTEKNKIGGLAGLPRDFAVGFSIGVKGYIGTGNTAEGKKNDFWEYNPATDSWTQKASFPGITRFGAVGLNIGNYGYIGHGDIGLAAGGYINDFWEYDPSLDTWSPKTTIGGPIRSLSTGFSIGNKGYVGTGYAEISSVVVNYNDFWEYTPSCTPPAAPVIVRSGDTLISSVATGNQWFLDGAAITGSTGKKYLATANGVYYSIVTVSGCSSVKSNSISVLDVSIKEVSPEIFDIYPNPSTGIVNIKIKTASKELYTIEIYNSLGALIWKQNNALIDGNNIKKIDLNSSKSGLYTIVLRSKANSFAKKVYVTK